MLLALLLACKPEPSPPAPTCPADSLEPGTVEVLATGFEDQGTRGTEGLVFSPDGRLFVGGAAHGGGGFVAEVHPGGTFDMLTPMVGSVGLEWWNGELAVAVGQDGAAGEVGGIVLVDPDSGDSRILDDAIPSANFPVLTPWGTLLVSAPSESSIVEVDVNGIHTTWLDGIESPNGMVFDDAASNLYVAQTYEAPNIFRRVEVTPEGASGAVHDLAEFDAGSTQDGVAIDANGDVYVVLNLPGQVVRITPSGQTEILASGVDFGASLQFGRGDFDPCSLYVTSLFTEDLFRVGAGVPGR